MKTAISLPDKIFREAERVAKEHSYSRSELFTLALKEFLERIKARELLDAINEAYSDIEPLKETDLRQKGKRYYSHRILRKPVGN
ncbi:MAG: CopG family transcriptional regulator [Nitrospirae bacterium]|nr:CopG family transcriptional regulator [Nitrospirota bacterium]